MHWYTFNRPFFVIAFGGVLYDFLDAMEWKPGRLLGWLACCMVTRLQAWLLRCVLRSTSTRFAITPAATKKPKQATQKCAIVVAELVGSSKHRKHLTTHWLWVVGTGQGHRQRPCAGCCCTWIGVVWICNCCFFSSCCYYCHCCHSCSGML